MDSTSTSSRHTGSSPSASPWCLGRLESTKGNRMSRIFSAIGTFSVRFRWPIVIAWVLVTVVSVKALPGLADVAKDAQSSFLPANTPSVQAQQLAQPFQDSKH